MKKFLLLTAALMVLGTSGNAQVRRSDSKSKPAIPQRETYQPVPQMQEMQMRTPGTPVAKAPKKANYVDAYYYRPAGAFTGNIVVQDGASAGLYYAPYVFTTPYVDYTFHGFAEGASDAAEVYWDYQYWTNNGQVWDATEGSLENLDLTVSYGYEVDSVPILTVYDGSTFDQFFLHGYKMSGTSSAPVIDATYCSMICAVPDIEAVWEQDILKSAKNFCYGGLNGDQRYPMTYYSGATAYGKNENGWWFGKNGSGIDGIAQVYEKPTFPYLLNQVVIDCAVLDVAADVDMTCKIYKLDQVPAYSDTSCITMQEVPGELIATGRATVTPTTNETTGGLVFFTLYGEEDGLEFEITPTIDCAIMVVIDGYNDDEQANLTDFSVMICSDTDVDEGFGETAYLLYPEKDEDGNLTGSHFWAGLNNFFSIGQMKTGFTIFLSTNNPFLTFNYTTEDGVYLFPAEGGVMEKEVYNDGAGNVITTKSIEFYAWTPSADEGWTLTCDGGDVPEWLTIELTDGEEDGEFSNVVNALVTADALPAGVAYREATVRFEFPGAYLDYTFKQGDESQSRKTGDVNGDGEVTIADVNAVIDFILSGEYDQYADVNGDGEVTIADVNAVIDIILSAE